MRHSIRRREFLYLVLLSGAAVGCRRVPADPPPSATPTALIITATPPVTLDVQLRFVLENEAINYHPNPGGCEKTTIQGTVRDASGTPLVGLTIHVWMEGDPQQALILTTGVDGLFSVDIEQALSDKTYDLQLVADAGATLLSDVIVAQAIPSCDLNLIEVNFVAAP